jgi:hypothetical protein
MAPKNPKTGKQTVNKRSKPASQIPRFSALQLCLAPTNPKTGKETVNKRSTPPNHITKNNRAVREAHDETKVAIFFGT